MKEYHKIETVFNRDIDGTKKLIEGSFRNETVEMLKGSQGFYSRLWNTISEMSDDELENAKEQLNNLDTKFKDSVDVVMFLES
jgi:hypothetical protein